MERVTPKTIAREYYSDFHKDLLQNPVSLDLARKTNEESVKESILNLLLTDRGERLFQPNLGCDIRKMLFENMTPDVIITMREIIRETIENYEPRANLISVDVSSTLDSNAVNIRVVFNVINSEDDIVLVTTLTRVR